MALSNDQRALLRLLAQREEGYGDIGALLGVGVDEVRTRVRDALAELEAGSGAVTAAPRAKEPAPVPPPPSPPPPPNKPAPPVSRSEPTRAPTRPRASFAAAAGTAVRHLPRPGTRRGLYELVGGIVVVVLLVLFATGTIDIGGGRSKSGTSATTPLPGKLPSGKVKPTAAVLSPVGGGSASGRALFGRSKETVLLLVEAKGLTPSAKGQSYAISLARSATERVPIAATEVGKSGTVAGQYQIAPESLGLLASGYDQMEIALVSNAALKAALTKAKQERKPLSYSGTPVLRGAVTGPFIKKK